MSWYSSLFAGALPLFILGFAASAVANRLIFVAWGAAFAVVYAGLLHHGWRAGWRRSALAAAALAVLAAAAGIFAVLVVQHREVLDLGLRALGS